MSAPFAPAETHLVSPSQITNFRACQRAWAFDKIAEVERVSTSSQALGTEVDDEQLQPYLRDGRAFDYTRESGYIAASALAYLPKPQSPGLEVQKHFLMPALSSVPGQPAPFGYQGYQDLWLPLRGAPDPIPWDGVSQYVIPEIIDFKTTSDLKWAKDAKALAVDVQAMVYAGWAMYSTGARLVDLHWIYMQTRGARKTHRTSIRVDAEHVVGQLLEIEATALEIMAAHAALASFDKLAAPLELPPNTDHCDAYAGCPHRHRCNLSPSQHADAAAAKAERNRLKKGLPIMSNTPAPAGSLLERMRAKKAGAAGAPPVVISEKPAPHFGSPETAPAPTSIPAAFLPPQTLPAVGINPPESSLPPAPPTGAAAPTSTAPAAPPARRGRPPKATTEINTVTNIAAPVSGESFEVSWAEERFCPVAYQSFGVGPFKASGTVQEGETLGEAMRRVSAILYAFATEERANKAEAFKRALGGGEK